MFPAPKKNKKTEDEDDDVPEEYQLHKSLYVICNGDTQKMEWFYNNKTEADLMLMIYLRNNTAGYFTGMF